MDLLNHFLCADNVFAFQVATSFGGHLIFDCQSRDAGGLKGLNCVIDVDCVSISCVGICNKRDMTSGNQVPCGFNVRLQPHQTDIDRKSTRLNSSHVATSYAV